MLKHMLTYRHSYFLKMASEVETGASSSIIAYGEHQSYEPPKIDLPVYL